MTPEEITTLFTTAAAAFQPIIGQPTDDDLTAIRDILYPLLLDIPYDEAGTHNLIGLIEPTTTYTDTCGDAFPIPQRPPTYPDVPDAATAVVRARREAEHAILVKDFATFEAAERATAKFLRDAVDEIWYRDLRHARSFYTNVTAKQLMEHLDANCGGLHPAELINLPTEMLSYYTQADGIPEYINMLEEAQRKLARANLPMSDDQLLAIASTSVLASGHFPRPTDEWEALACNHKTWTAWKTHYRAAHIARKRQMLAAGATPTSGMAHAVMGGEDTTISPDTFTRLDGYLDNLAAAATTERSTLAQLIETNATLTANIATLTTSVASLTAAYAILAANKQSTTQTPATGKKRSGGTTANKNLAVGGYCWTHGYRVAKGHNSNTCNTKAEGHKDAATRANTMNGSTANKGWDDN
jgi:hypothetical protein